jgi:DNA-binding MarR family transcriptional regulator
MDVHMNPPVSRARPSARTEERAVLDALRRIVRALRLSSGAARATGVSGAQLFLLQLLAEAGTSSLNRLAERAHTDQSTASVVVSRLVRRGLVSRRRSEDDGRCVELTLSAEGRRLARRAPAPAQARLLEGLRRLPPARLQGLARDLALLAEEMGMAEARAPLFFEEETPKEGSRGRARR